MTRTRTYQHRCAAVSSRPPAPRSLPAHSRTVAVLLVCAALLHPGPAARGEPTAVPVPDFAAVLHPLMAKRFDNILEAVRARPDDPAVIGELGCFYEANLFPDLAAACYERASTLAPDDPQWMFHRAAVARATDDLKFAEKALRLVLARRPDHAASREQLGLALLADGSLDEAATAFERLIELRPDMPSGYVGLARVRLARNNAEEAEGLLRRAVDVAPNWNAARYYLAVALRALGRPAEAEAEAARGTDTRWMFIPDPWYADVTRQAAGREPLMAVARGMRAMGATDNAIRIYRTLLTVDPRDVPVAQELADLYLRANRPADVVLMLREPLLADPDNLRTNIQLAAGFFGIGRLSDSQAHAEAALKLNPNSAEASYGLGLALAAQGEYDSAIAALHRAVEFGGGDPRYAQAVCELLIHQERWNEADAPCRTALSREPKETAHLYNLGRVSLKLGRIDEAIRYLQLAAERKPDDAAIQQALKEAAQTQSGE